MQLLEIRKVPNNGYLSLKKLKGKQIAIYELTENDLLKLQGEKIINSIPNEIHEIHEE